MNLDTEMLFIVTGSQGRAKTIRANKLSISWRIRKLYTETTVNAPILEWGKMNVEEVVDLHLKYHPKTIIVIDKHQLHELFKEEFSRPFIIIDVDHENI